MALKNYTTTIDADKTANEIGRMLAKAGAKAVLTEYSDNGEYLESLSFKIRVNDRDVGFRLPVDWKPVQRVLKKQKKNNSRIKATREQAVRVAWRIAKDWIDAQLAIIETDMVEPEQVFLPYMVTQDNRTLYEQVRKNKFLPEGSHEQG